VDGASCAGKKRGQHGTHLRAIGAEGAVSPRYAGCLTRAYLPLLLLLAAIWGASYLFIKVAVDDFEPATMMLARLVIASSLLVPFLVLRNGLGTSAAELRRAWRPGLVLGVINAALPFTLIAWGEKQVDSGVAAIANATVPIFVTLLAIRFKQTERATGGRLVGIVVGLVGVAILAGGQPDVGLWTVLGTLAVVLASLSYAVSQLYGQLRVSEAGGAVLAAASMLAGALVLLPFGLATLPHEVPGWQAIASVLALSVLGTALAQLILFRMLRLHGASRVSLVTYLMPAMAVFYGAVLLGEPVTAGVAGGLVLVLAGVALGSGAIRLPRRREVRAATPQP
jgi:drug/metabolite transporter (DMT)-like permease